MVFAERGTGVGQRPLRLAAGETYGASARHRDVNLPTAAESSRFGEENKRQNWYYYWPASYSKLRQAEPVELAGEVMR